MLKKIKTRKHQVISGLASECEVLEQQISDSISEILKLVDSINIDLESYPLEEPAEINVLEVINEEQAEAS